LGPNAKATTIVFAEKTQGLLNTTKMKRNIITINLAAVFVTAFALTTFLHEGAHALMAVWLGIAPVWFHTYVSYDNSTVPELHQALVAASGPLFSMLQAIVFYFLLRKRTTRDFMGYLYLWMTIVGSFAFLGYIMMGPFVAYGDTGKVYRILSIPSYVTYSLAVIAVVLFGFLFRKLIVPNREFIMAMRDRTAGEVNKPVQPFFVIPVMTGTIFNVLLSLPAPTGMSLAFPLLIPVIMIPTAIRLFKTRWPMKSESAVSDNHLKPVYWPLMAAVLLLIVSRILATGIQL
jgi:hypothetical protein